MTANIQRAAAAMIGLLFASLSLAAGPATRDSGGVVTAGRDTPAGAMNVLEKAMDAGDLATAADSFYVRPDADPDGSARRSVASQRIAMRQFQNAVAAHFNATDATAIFTQCRVPPPRPAAAFAESTWTLLPNETNYAQTRLPPDVMMPESRFMTRCPDGNWRIGTGRLMSMGNNLRFGASPAELAAHVGKAAQGIQAGQLTTVDAVVHAAWPDGTPAERAAKMQAQMQQQQAQQQQLPGPLDIIGGMMWGMAEQQAQQDQAADRQRRWKPSAPDAQTIAAAQPASPPTQPVVAHRDTPANSLRTYEIALDNGDLQATADSLSDMPPADAPTRHALALQAIAERRFFRTSQDWFGRDGAVRICFYCEVPVPPSSIADADWRIVWGHTDTAMGRPYRPDAGHEPNKPNMHRGPDGQWKIESQNRFATADDGVSTAAHLNEIATGIESGEFSEVAEAIHAVQYRADIPFTETPPLSPGNTDPANLDGAYGVFVRAVRQKDAAALTALFHADGDGDGRLVKAEAQRIILAYALQDTVNAKFSRYGTLLAARFGLLTGADHPEWGGALASFGTTPSEATDTEIGTHYRLRAGLWKIDITPAPPQTAADLAAKLEHGNDQMRRIADDVRAGNFANPGQVRDAMLAAAFTAAAEADFVAGNYRLPNERN